MVDSTGKVEYDGWLYVTVTRGSQTIATSPQAGLDDGGPEFTVRGLRWGDVVTVYAKQAVFVVNTSTNFEGFVGAPGPFHVAATATFKPAPIITNVGCNPHYVISGPAGGSSFVAATFGPPGATKQGGSVSGSSFTLTDPKIQRSGGVVVCGGATIAGIRYEPEPDGTVQVNEYEAPENIQLGWLQNFHNATKVFRGQGQTEPIRHSRVVFVPGAFCAPDVISACRVKSTAILPGGSPTVVGSGTVTLQPGQLRNLELTLTAAGAAEVRKKLAPLSPGHQLTIPLTMRLTGTGRKTLLVHGSLRLVKN